MKQNDSVLRNMFTMIHQQQLQQELKEKLMATGSSASSGRASIVKPSSAFNVIKNKPEQGSSSSPSSSSSSSSSSITNGTINHQHTSCSTLSTASMANNILQNLLEMNSKNFLMNPGFHSASGSHVMPPGLFSQLPGMTNKSMTNDMDHDASSGDEKNHFNSFNEFYQAAISNLSQQQSHMSPFRNPKDQAPSLQRHDPNNHHGLIPGGLKVPSYFESPLANVQIQYDCAAPIARNTPENNECRLINYRQTKIASFRVDGKELICLPQAFEMFLKTLVGGLHTVYTKLKRLDITPIVCNVEQVIHLFLIQYHKLFQPKYISILMFLFKR